MKHARDMTAEEFADAKKQLGKQSSVRRSGMTDHEMVATIIRGMSIPELHAFEKQFGISITPGTQVVKKYEDMTPEEQEKFRTQHRITVK